MIGKFALNKLLNTTQCNESASEILNTFESIGTTWALWIASLVSGWWGHSLSPDQERALCFRYIWKIEGFTLFLFAIFFLRWAIKWRGFHTKYVYFPWFSTWDVKQINVIMNIMVRYLSVYMVLMRFDTGLLSTNQHTSSSQFSLFSASCVFYQPPARAAETSSKLCLIKVHQYTHTHIHSNS